MIGIVFYAAIFAAPAEVEKIRSDGFATLGYSANWKFIFAGQSYFDQFSQPSPFRHMWSLAIEEQFYLIWPLIVFGVLWFTRSVRALLGTAFAMMLGSAVLMAVLYSPGHDPSRVYYGTDTRVQSLLMGAVASILVYLHGPIRTAFMRRTLGVLAVIGAGYTLWLWSTLSERSDLLYRGGFLLASLAVVLVIVSVTQPNRGLLGRALSWYPLRWIGMISYGLYLWHWPVYLTITGTRTGLEGNALLFARLGVTFAFASLSYYLVERPIRRGTFHIPRPAFTRARARGRARRGARAGNEWLGYAAGEFRPRSISAGSSASSASSASSGNSSSSTSVIPTQPAPDRSALAAEVPAPPPPQQASVLLLGDSVAMSLGQGLDVVAQQDPSKLVSVNRGTLGLRHAPQRRGRHGPPALRASRCVQRLERALGHEDRRVPSQRRGAAHRSVGPPRSQHRRHVVPARAGRLRPLLPVRARPGNAGPRVTRRQGGDPHDTVLLPARARGPDRPRLARVRAVARSTASTRSTATSSSRTRVGTRSSTSTGTSRRAGSTPRASTAFASATTVCTSRSTGPSGCRSGSHRNSRPWRSSRPARKHADVEHFDPRHLQPI